jgi:hypothetical protein
MAATTAPVALARRSWQGFGGVINWFPGHMAKAVRLLDSRVSSADVLLEIRDARVCCIDCHRPWCGVVWCGVVWCGVRDVVCCML